MLSFFVLYLVDAVFEIFMCNPKEEIWNPLLTTGHCFDSAASCRATWMFNVISDFAIPILPMLSLWKPRMPITKKAFTLAVFVTGSL